MTERGFAPKFSKELLESIKQRIILSDLVGASVSLKRRGADFVGLCPFHKEKTPSFSVSDEKGLYYCFGCGAGGNCFDFIKNVQGIHFAAAVEDLARRAGVSLPVKALMDESLAKEEEEKQKAYATLEKITRWYEERLLLPEGRLARDYLLERGISEGMQKRFRLGYAPDRPGDLMKEMERKGYLPEYLEKIGVVGCERREGQKERYWERFRNRIMFPIMDSYGRVIAFGGRAFGEVLPKYINSSETFIFHKSEILYGFNEAVAHKALVRSLSLGIVEGYSDVINLWDSEIPAVAPLGTALSHSHIYQAWKLCCEPVVIFDGDEAGQRAAFRCLERAFEILQPGFSLKFCILPQEQDPDSFIRTYGKESFKEVLGASQSMLEFFWSYSLAHHRVDTPEFQVLFKKTLLKRVASIQVKDIRLAYEREVIKRYNLHFSPVPVFKKRPMLMNKEKKAPLRPILSSFYGDKRHIQEKILILSFIYYPDLMTDYLERLSSMEIKDKNLKGIYEGLVEYYGTKKPLECACVKDYLSQLDGVRLSALLDPQILLYAPFLKKPHPLETVKVLWEEIWVYMQEKRQLAQEWMDMQQSLQEEATEEAWERLKALQHEKEEDHR